MNHDAMFKMLLKAPTVLRGFFDAFLPDWQDFDLPVYPIAVLSHKKRASGCQLPLRVDFPNKQVLHFEFDVIDLARMDAEQETRFTDLCGVTRIHHGISVWVSVGPWALLLLSPVVLPRPA